MSQLGFSINLAKCVGCRACAVACNAELHTVKETRYRMVVEKEGGTETEPKRLFVTRSCFHCEDPSCLKACPVNAITQDKKFGVVLIDQNACIGCKRCAAVCPYGNPKFNERTKKMEKCTFCVHRVLNHDRSALTGLKPACVNTCIGNALNFGEDVGNAGVIPSGFASRTYTNPSVSFDWGWMEPW